MSSPEELKAHVVELMRSADTKLEEHRRAREDLMEQIEERRLRFEGVANDLMSNTVRPRIEVILHSFPHAGPIVDLDGGCGLAVPFAHTDEFPAHARVEVNLTHDRDCHSAWCGFSPTIIPMLIDYERDTSLELNLGAPDRERLEAFLDERIERFVASYLSLRDPDSVYQRDLRVTDPVCGMTFRRLDAQASLDYEGRKVFFCTDTCRKRFESAPERYVRPGTFAKPG